MPEAKCEECKEGKFLSFLFKQLFLFYYHFYLKYRPSIFLKVYKL